MSSTLHGMPRTPLGTEQLKAIQSRRRGDPDVTTLLWEIHRLRITVLSAHTFVQAVGSAAPLGTYAGIASRDLRARLATEPVVIEEMATGRARRS